MRIFLKSSLFLLLLMYFAKTMKSCLKKLNLKTKHVSRSWRVSIRKILKIAVTFKLKLEDYIVPRLFGTGRKKVFPWHVQLTYWAIIWCFTDSLFYHGQLLNASSTRINLTKCYVGTLGKLEEVFGDITTPDPYSVSWTWLKPNPIWRPHGILL